MEITRKWSVLLKNNIDGGGVLPPTRDPFDRSAFYVTDGWGSYYSSIRLRRLSLETGEELASALVRDGARCLWAGEDALFAILTKRVVKLSRPSLKIMESWKGGIPQGSDYVAFDGDHTLLLMNWAASFLFALDLETGKAKRKKLPGGCRGIFREDPGRFLVLNGRAVYRYAMETAALDKLADTEPYDGALRGKSGRLYLLQKRLAGEGPRVSAVLVYPAPGSCPGNLSPERILSVPWPRQPEGPGVPGLWFALSGDEETLYFMQDDFLWFQPVREDKPVFQHKFQGEYVYAVFDDSPREASVLTYGRTERRLTRWTVLY